MQSSCFDSFLNVDISRIEMLRGVRWIKRKRDIEMGSRTRRQVHGRGHVAPICCSYHCPATISPTSPNTAHAMCSADTARCYQCFPNLPAVDRRLISIHIIGLQGLTLPPVAQRPRCHGYHATVTLLASLPWCINIVNSLFIIFVRIESIYCTGTGSFQFSLVKIRRLTRVNF